MAFKFLCCFFCNVSFLHPNRHQFPMHSIFLNCFFVFFWNIIIWNMFFSDNCLLFLVGLSFFGMSPPFLLPFYSSSVPTILRFHQSLTWSWCTCGPSKTWWGIFRLFSVDHILYLLHAYVYFVLFPSRDFFIVVVWYDDSFFCRADTMSHLSHVLFWCFIRLWIILVDLFTINPGHETQLPAWMVLTPVFFVGYPAYACRYRMSCSVLDNL